MEGISQREDDLSRQQRRRLEREQQLAWDTSCHLYASLGRVNTLMPTTFSHFSRTPILQT